MIPLRIFTDEDMPGALAAALRAAAVDGVSTPEAGRLGQLDEAQLKWATQAGRVLVSFNVGDFVALHSAWLQVGRSHAGIVVSTQRPIGDALRRLLSLVTALDADAMRDRLEFLSDW
jgi:hypothetical protein